MKPLLPTADTHVQSMREESRLNSFLMLYYCVGEKLKLEVVLRYEACKSIKIPSFGWCVSTEKWQLRWIGILRIYSSFGGRLDLIQVRDCKGIIHMEKTMGLNTVGERAQKCDRENNWHSSQIKSIDRC